MAEPNKDPNGGGAAAPSGEPGLPVIQIISQYVKDLSFENPSMGVNVRQPQIDFTVDDPKSYTSTWTVRVDQRLLPDQELIEFVCNENQQFGSRIQLD